MQSSCARVSFLLIALATLTMAAPASAATLGADSEGVNVALRDGINDYEDSHWSVAYARFAKLADSGNAEAARIALLMVRHGPQLYGQGWRAPQSQVEQWLNLAARRLSELDSAAGD